MLDWKTENAQRAKNRPQRVVLNVKQLKCKIHIVTLDNRAQHILIYL